MRVKPNDPYRLASNDTEVLKKSNRLKIILILFIILLVFALAGLAYLGYNVFLESMSKTHATVQPTTTMTELTVADMNAPKTVVYKKTSIPNLAALFGMNIDQVGQTLGPEFVLVRTSPSEDSSNPNIVQLAVFSYIPEIIDSEQSDISTAQMPTQSIYASLDQYGVVIDIYYLCDMRLLDYPSQSFNELLSTEWLLLNTIQTAGVYPRDFYYTAPNPEECIVYDNVNSNNRKITKQSYIFSGRTTSEALPTVWTLTVTYDFGSGVESQDDFSRATRLIYIRLG